MASISIKEDVIETRVIEKGGVVLTLTNEEAEGLGLLLRGGVGSSTIGVLGLRGVLDVLRDNSFGEEERRNWIKWSQTAQRSSL